jgi:hypothetical protein
MLVSKHVRVGIHYNIAVEFVLVFEQQKALLCARLFVLSYYII